MIKAHMDLTRNGEKLATLSWHARDADGNTLPIGFEWTDAIDDDMKERVVAVCSKPVPLTGPNGVRTGMAQPGSSKHFENLARHIERLGCRTHYYY
ncbi:MAG: hypothetical protein ABFC80_02385 [Coriobacteriales bacterium]|nr:hypothetical protein [Actinomycetes bacterium]